VEENVEITPETEARLQTVAALLTEQKQMPAELRVSVEDHEAGRSMSLEEYKARTMARRQAHDSAREDQ